MPAAKPFRTRDLPIVPARTAIVVIDAQNGLLHEAAPEERSYFAHQLHRVALPNIARLIARARAVGMEVIYTVIESLTLDGRDRCLDYKVTGFNYPKGCWESRVLDAVAPAGDEIVLPKTSSSLFNSTIFDYLLRNLGVDAVIVTGFLTDQCIDTAVRDGADRGYEMICITDACATKSAERHDWALRLNQGYCRQATTDEILAEMA
ncbi:cysteine hydrolase [Zavarzinia compransoris]|uniref:cysteine hydrolase family protein n=1 Tax=Zavarzinia marina TaxID=2911065 RepID=UPI001F26ED2A|nr:isochorismatase family cysteine hydrolase [Zavarzinia marina]MCF4165798.1 cysteine hydrolase [Zavarzinia marina]